MDGKENSLKKSIQKAVNLLQKRFKIKEVVLFGSQLSKKADKWSDIDLLVISPDFEDKTFEEIINVFAELALEFTPEIELHPYTPDDLKKARPTNFLGNILKRGKTVFQDGRFLS